MADQDLVHRKEILETAANLENLEPKIERTATVSVVT
jgi:hypothetical protein